MTQPRQFTIFPSELLQPGNNIVFPEICRVLGFSGRASGWPDKFGDALQGYITKNQIRPINTLSLFSGAGGLDIGFHDAGFNIVASVEIESKFCKTLKANSGQGKKFAASTVNCIDIRNFSGDGLESVDFIIGGPPCQTFSAAGRRAAGVSGTTDSRGVLFREYVRLLKKLKPKGFLFENVYGIIGAQNGEAWREIQQSFAEAGYHLFYRILDAADYGVPQHRERLIIVGLKEGTFRFPRPTHGPDSLNNEPFYTAGLAVKGLHLTAEESKSGITGKFGHLIFEIPPGLNYSYFTREMGHPNPIFAWRSKFSDFMYKADPNMPVRTIKAQGGQYTGPLHWDSRYFSLSEFKRLQTFPDDYEICGAKNVAVQQIGNSVPPQLARVLAVAIRMQVFGTKFPFDFYWLAERDKLSFRSRKRDLTKYYRQKAAEAIQFRYAQKGKPKQPVDEHFFFSLDDKFHTVKDASSGQWSVSVNWDKDLNISISPAVYSKKSNHTLCLEVSPKGNWTLPVEKINMRITFDGWLTVTAAWKVLESELAENRYKADLVQLNGYYQYDSELNCSLTGNDIPNMALMQTVYSGLVVGKNVPIEKLAEAWKVKVSDVIPCAQNLRKLGYEVRNRRTNPQLPDDVLLIPYKFPTLRPESIQLGKKLI